MVKKMYMVKEKIKSTVLDVAKDERGDLWQFLLVALVAVVLAGVVLKLFDVSITDLGAGLVNKVKSTFGL